LLQTGQAAIYSVSSFIGFGRKNLAVQGGDVSAEGAASLSLTFNLA
jgi:hypothetical protein